LLLAFGSTQRFPVACAAGKAAVLLRSETVAELLRRRSQHPRRQN
jgi:hypothetical protein